MPSPTNNTRPVKHLLLDEREIVFVSFPSSMTGNEVTNKLYWAKWWYVKALLPCFVVMCGVKPWYLKHFIKENKDNRLWFQKTPLGFRVDIDKDNGLFVEWDD